MANTTWNPSDKTAGGTLSGGNLTFTGAGGSGVRSVDRFSTGKRYWEYTCTTWSGANSLTVGVASAAATLSSAYNTPTNAAVIYPSDGSIWVNNTNTGVALGARANGDIIGVALDQDTKRIWFRVAPSGNWNGNASYNPATGAGGISIVAISADGNLVPLYGVAADGALGSGKVVTANFGDSAFSGAVPSGFTSGFPTGIPTLLAAATQIALEEWAMPNAAAQATLVAAEMWGAVATGNRLALATLVALEEWANVPSVAPRGGQAAVTINTG